MNTERILGRRLLAAGAAACVLALSAFAAGSPAPGPSVTTDDDLDHRILLPWMVQQKSPKTIPRWGHFVNDLGPIQALALEASAGLAYVGQGARITIVDVSLPAGAHEVGRLEPLGATIEQLRVVGDRLYAATGTGGMVILDISRPAQPRVAGTFAQPIHRLAAKEGLVVAIAGEPRADVAASRVLSIDVHDPGKPALLDTLESRGICRFTDVDLSGDRAYVSSIPCALFSLDISRPDALRIVHGDFADHQDVSDLRVQDGVLYEITEGDSVGMWNAADLKDPSLGAVTAAYPFASGETWYLDVLEAIAVLDHQLMMVGRFDRPHRHGAAGLWVMDVSSPDAPTLIGVADSDAPSTVEMTWTHIFVGGSDGLQIYPRIQ